MRSFYNNRYGCHSFDQKKDDIHNEHTNEHTYEHTYDPDCISNPKQSKYNITTDEANYFHTIQKTSLTNSINPKFPKNFKHLGLSTAAYQIEGGRTEEENV